MAEAARKKLLLHACCGPCSLEPLRLLQEEGFDIVICWSNDNIQPVQEHDLRYETLKGWADELGISVVALPEDRDAWERHVAIHGLDRNKRCRACYANRLNKLCQMAKAEGFAYVSTTLAVSPYQLFDVCTEILERLASHHGLTAVIRDFRPYYQNACERSRALGMYRQNYCGCRFSAAEACMERHHNRDLRKAQKQACKSNTK